MKEAVIEAYLVEQVDAFGGVAEKYTSPGRKHVPDRLVLWPKGVAEFVELKKPGKKATPGQRRDHLRRAALGFHVEVIDNKADVDIYVRRYR